MDNHNYRLFIRPFVARKIQESFESHGNDHKVLLNEFSKDEIDQFAIFMIDEHKELWFIHHIDAVVSLDSLIRSCFRTQSDESKLMLSNTILERVIKLYEVEMQLIINDIADQILEDLK